jgi:hypothetical protein
MKACLSPEAQNSYPISGLCGSFNYKYIYYGCSSDTVEEFFDMVNDPEENTNLINNSSYDSLIQFYRNRLAVLRQNFMIRYQELRSVAI